MSVFSRYVLFSEHIFSWPDPNIHLAYGPTDACNYNEYRMKGSVHRAPKVLRLRFSVNPSTFQSWAAAEYQMYILSQPFGHLKPIERF